MSDYKDTLKELESLRLSSNEMLQDWQNRIILTGLSEENTQKALLKAIAEEEKYVNMMRKLPHETFLSKPNEMLNEVFKSVYGLDFFEMEAGFCLKIPMLLPKKEKESATYIRTILQNFMMEVTTGNHVISPINEEVTLIFIHQYDKNKSITLWRDNSNVETNVVEDILNLYLFKDDTGYYCRHIFLSEKAENDGTLVYILKNKYVPNFINQFYDKNNGGEQ